MENEGDCKECGHSLESHRPDFSSGKMQKCNKCECEGYIYPL